MTDDVQIEGLIKQAHLIFGKTSIYEVIDIEDWQLAIKTLVEYYGPVDRDDLEEYLGILNQIRNYERGT